jgi:ABC-type dipeptide/oligopeptide/nickel transport system ATPase subunit
MTVVMNGEIVEIKNIWIGEVWITAGQSNMSFMFWEMYRRGIAITDFELNKNIHYFETTVDGNLNYNEGGSGWFECTKDNIMRYYSILPYYFALKLQNKLDGIHVAVLNASRGWTRIESWIPSKYINGTDLDLDRSLKVLAPASDISNGQLFEGYVRPFVPYATNGLVWYQGESNEGLKECEYYSQLLEMLISSWRNEFCEEFPVLLVQLTAYGSYIKKDATVEDKCNYNDDGPECVWAKLREQQLIASQQIKDVYMVTTIDTSEFSQIHPTGKDIVAERLAIAANNIISNKREEERYQNQKASLRIKAEKSSDPINSLSGGNQQKVFLARWLNTEANILLFDNPTQGVDVGAKAEIYQLVMEFAKQGKSIIINTLEIPEIMKVADRCAVLYEGKITRIFEHNEINEKDVMLYSTNAVNAEGDK